jgi:hypothetical protein
VPKKGIRPCTSNVEAHDLHCSIMNDYAIVRDLRDSQRISNRSVASGSAACGQHATARGQLTASSTASSPASSLGGGGACRPRWS